MAGVILTCDHYGERYVLLIERRFSQYLENVLCGNFKITDFDFIAYIPNTERQMIKQNSFEYVINKMSIKYNSIDEKNLAESNYNIIKRLQKTYPYNNAQYRYEFPKELKNQFDCSPIDTAIRAFQENTEVDIKNIHITNFYTNYKGYLMYKAYTNNIKMKKEMSHSNKIFRSVFVNIKDLYKYVELDMNIIKFLYV